MIISDLGSYDVWKLGARNSSSGDPEMCDRSKHIIPGLLRRLNDLESSNEERNLENDGLRLLLLQSLSQIEELKAKIEDYDNAVRESTRKGNKYMLLCLILFALLKESLARAYMFYGEKNWDNLRLLFQEGPDSPKFVQAVDSVETIKLSSVHDDDASFVSPKWKGKEAESRKEKEGYLVGKEGEPDTEWWADVAMGDPIYFSDGEVSQPSE